MHPTRALHPGAPGSPQHCERGNYEGPDRLRLHQLLHGFRVGKKCGIGASPLQNPITMYNVDGTQNRDGKIRFGMDLLVRVGDHQEWIHFLLGKTQSHMVILGHDWLKRHNPAIDWMKAEVKLTRCPKTCSSPPHCHPTPPKASTLA